MSAPTAFHRTSQWQEAARDDELTLYEIHRSPRRIVNQNRLISCQLQMLNPQLRCVVCLGYLKETTMVMECLHRFCKECIHNCIRFGSKECPNCRKSIPSRRSLRRDHKFDEIVKHTIGDPGDHDEDQLGVNDRNKMVRLQRAIFEKKRIVTKQKKQRHKTDPIKEPKAPIIEPSDMQDLQRIENLKESPLLELELRRHPHEDKVDRLGRAFLTLRGDANVSLLKRFLSKKLEDRVYEISSTLDDDSVVLDDDLPLMEAKETLCTEKDQTMILKYRVSAGVSKRTEVPMETRSNNETSEHIAPSFKMSANENRR